MRSGSRVLWPDEEGRYPIPKGCVIYLDRLEVAGLSYREDNALRFLRGTEQALELEPEPSNKHDPNAIRVIGHHRSAREDHRAHIGYLPREVARVLAKHDLISAVWPRLEYAKLKHEGYARLVMQIVGPKGRYREVFGRELDVEAIDTAQGVWLGPRTGDYWEEGSHSARGSETVPATVTCMTVGCVGLVVVLLLGVCFMAL